MVLPFIVVSILIFVAASSFASSAYYGSGPSPFGILVAIVAAIFSLALIVPSLAVQVRRLHDIGLPGWVLIILIVLAVIPFIGILAFIGYIVLGFINSQPGSNQYGPPPKRTT